MKRTLILIHGDKGGIGKSILAKAVADYLLCHNTGKPLFILDADTRNADVSRTHPEISERVNLFTHEGWGELFDFIESKEDADILVNFPGQIGKEIPGEIESLKMLLEENDMQLIVYFIIDRNPDTINLLKEAASLLLPITKSHFVVVKNLYSSPNDQFEEYDESEIATLLKSAKAKEFKMPEIAYKIKKTLSGSFHGVNKEQPVRISEFLATDPPASIRIDLRRWHNTMFENIANIHAPFMVGEAK